MILRTIGDVVVMYINVFFFYVGGSWPPGPLSPLDLLQQERSLERVHWVLSEWLYYYKEDGRKEVPTTELRKLHTSFELVTFIFGRLSWITGVVTPDSARGNLLSNKCSEKHLKRKNKNIKIKKKKT